jgi:hypothetical protein
VKERFANSNEIKEQLNDYVSRIQDKKIWHPTDAAHFGTNFTVVTLGSGTNTPPKTMGFAAIFSGNPGGVMYRST